MLQRIDDESVRRLCSGQVVADAAGAVKELVENALDARCTRCSVVLRGAAGAAWIEVADDGSGIASADFALVAAPHATSKRSADAAPTSLGFRGEALGALCAICGSVCATTATAETAPAATRLRFARDGRVAAAEPAVRARGTTVRCEGLFAPLPVRAKEHCANARRELARIVAAVQQYAVGCPRVRFALTHDGAELLSTDGSGSLRGSCAAVFGSAFTASLADVAADKVRGLASSSAAAAATVNASSVQLFFLNGRPVDLPRVAKRATELFRAALGRSAAAGAGAASRVRPALILLLEAPPDEFDVNMTPDKRTVLFHDEERVATAVLSALAGIWERGQARQVMRSATAPSLLARSRVLAPPEAKRPRRRTLETIVPLSQAAVDASQPAVLEDGSEVRVVVEDSLWSAPCENVAPSPTDIAVDVDCGAIVAAARALQREQLQPAGDTPPSKASRFQRRVGMDDDAECELEMLASFSKEDFSRLEVVGQFNSAFIVARLGRDLFIIDQHAADEIRNFEELSATTRLHVQPLLAPLPLEFSAEDEVLAMGALDELKRLGFVLQVDDDAPPGSRLRLASCTFSKSATFGSGDVHEYVALLREFSGPSQRMSRVRAMLAMRACKRSVKVGMVLDQSKMRQILQRLAALDAPWKCPHGRPTIRHLWSF